MESRRTGRGRYLANKVAGWTALGLAGLLVQDKFPGLDIDGGWLILTFALLGVALVVVVFTWGPVAGRISPRSPYVLVSKGELDWEYSSAARELVAATRSIQTELYSLRQAVRDAIQDKAPPRQLPTGEWNRLSGAFSDRRYVLGSIGYDTARRVYIAADRINHRAERWSVPLADVESRELEKLEQLASSAIKVLDTLIRTWP